MTSLYLVIGLLAGAVLGLVAGWWLGRRSTGDNRLESELRQQIAQRDTELGTCRSDLVRSQTTCAAAEAGRAAAQTMLEQQRQAHDRAFQEARQAQEKANADLREAFSAL